MCESEPLIAVNIENVDIRFLFGVARRDYHLLYYVRNWSTVG